MAKRIRTKNVTVDFEGLDKLTKQLWDDAIQDKTQTLIQYATQTLRNAYLESEFYDRTLNLKDSYVWGVYFEGRLIEHGFIGDEEATRKIRRTGDGELISGRDEAEKFIKNYTPKLIDGWEVVFAATIYYGQYLEMGTARNSQYVVISSIFDDLQRDFGNVDKLEEIYTY